MTTPADLDALLRAGATAWNAKRRSGKTPMDYTGATMQELFCANADLSKLSLVGTEWEDCELSAIDFRGADLSNAYFHGGALRDCLFAGADLTGATFEGLTLKRCTFTGAKGLDSLELDEVNQRDVEGLEPEEPAEEEPPPDEGA